MALPASPTTASIRAGHHLARQQRHRDPSWLRGEPRGPDRVCLPRQGFTVIPRIGAQYLHLSENGFSETGGSGFNLTRGQDIDSFQPMVGLTSLKASTLDDGIYITPAFKLAYRHALLSLTTPAGVGVPVSVVASAHNIVTFGSRQRCD
jgi:outer membrane autotransporter protein